MMPDRPNVGMERDLESFKELFESPAFRADGLKKSLPLLWNWGTGVRAVENRQVLSLFYSR